MNNAVVDSGDQQKDSATHTHQALTFLKSSPGVSNVHPRTTVLELGNPLHRLFLGAESAAGSPESLKQGGFCITLVAPEEVNILHGKRLLW